jgi:hypothetical protein
MSYLSGNSDSLASRLDCLVHQVEDNPTRFLGAVLDLENQLAACVEVEPQELVDSVTIEEIVDSRGYLKDGNIEEAVWLETLSRETDMDCRMILGFNPVKEVGLFRWNVLVNEGGEPVTYTIKVWVVALGKKGGE